MIFTGDQYADDWKWWLDTTIPILSDSYQRNYWRIWHQTVKSASVQIQTCHMFEYFDNALISDSPAFAYTGFLKPYRFIFRSAEDRLEFTAQLQSMLRANSLQIGFIKTGEHF